MNVISLTEYRARKAAELISKRRDAKFKVNTTKSIAAYYIGRVLEFVSCGDFPKAIDYMERGKEAYRKSL